MRWPGSKGENMSEVVLGSEVGPGSTAGEIVDTVELSVIGFTKLGIRSAIDGLGILLSDLELLKVRGEDARGSNGLVVINEHDPPMDDMLESSTSGVEVVLSPM